MVSFSFFLIATCILLYLNASSVLGSSDHSVPDGEFLGFLTVEQTDMYMETIHRILAKRSTAPKVIGTSRESNSIKAICIGACNSESPSVLFTALHHAREPMSLMTLAYTMEYIAEHSEKAEIQALYSASYPLETQKSIPLKAPHTQWRRRNPRP